jgi:hypothetical protein
LQNGHRCQFVRAQDLFDEMYAWLADRSTRQLLNRLARLDVLLIDEFGYLNLKPEQSNTFFKPMEERYHRHSTIITTNQQPVWISSGAAAFHPPDEGSLGEIAFQVHPRATLEFRFGPAVFDGHGTQHHLGDLLPGLLRELRNEILDCARAVPGKWRSPAQILPGRRGLPGSESRKNLRESCSRVA